MSTESQTILLVDPDLDHLEWATKRLSADGLRILRTDHAEKAIKVCDTTTVDLIIADIDLQPFDGLTLLTRIRAAHPGTLVILTAGFPSTAQIIESTQLGAQDILKKESLTFELRPVVETALQVIEQRRSAGESSKSAGPSPDSRVKIIGNSRALQNVFKIVGRVARTDAPVLVSGESGTGKELVANAIHEYSPRSKNIFIAINCGAIPENLLESELFGHEKGAFTGAINRRAGLFEQCDGGTLFLDEIGDMPSPVQVKLLRVLQDGTFSRVGGHEPQKSDVRIVAATNKNLAEEVAHERFREDLFYRLNVVEIHLPPLRARAEDIPLLAEHFLRLTIRRNGIPPLTLSREALNHLQNHRWPGNVRELENTIARACALASNDMLLPDDIPFTKTFIDKETETRKTKEALQHLLRQVPEGQDPGKWISKKVDALQSEAPD
ncbi:sigma-54-dependent Fis family transcriptional regulator [Verrucomicrobiaceae bacterium N1E253]|uniref:DNA-binding transcriptional regulator NtrC n=1 Tax=Oceaniferula marina TaxID=2748318 RepID=A0A851GES3_9BACT|nr:sigma 54-interacting transcriptional regulator [Oceaniferula marina]NWK55392.1 sigma-54-dependent Fis family transcriptional regulator [Oceaniferula marina]